jgi:hypothetical protein
VTDISSWFALVLFISWPASAFVLLLLYGRVPGVVLETALHAGVMTVALVLLLFGGTWETMYHPEFPAESILPFTATPGVTAGATIIPKGTLAYWLSSSLLLLLLFTLPASVHRSILLYAQLSPSVRRLLKVFRFFAGTAVAVLAMFLVAVSYLLILNTYIYDQERARGETATPLPWTATEVHSAPVLAIGLAIVAGLVICEWTLKRRGRGLAGRLPTGR